MLQGMQAQSQIFIRGAEHLQSLQPSHMVELAAAEQQSQAPQVLCRTTLQQHRQSPMRALQGMQTRQRALSREVKRPQGTHPTQKQAPATHQ